MPKTINAIPCFSSHMFFRLTCGSSTTCAFDTNFLRYLFASSPSQWVHRNCDREINVFDCNVLLFPFEARGYKSLFAVIGAGNIRSYTTRGFSGDRPCILHLDPTNTPRGRHNPHAVGDKIHIWLNKLWRWTHDSSDHLVMPFNKRSMPVCRPYGEQLSEYHLFLSNSFARPNVTSSQSARYQN